jgi:hypothetical protein
VHLHGPAALLLLLVIGVCFLALINPGLWRRLRTRGESSLPSGVVEFLGGMSLEVPFFGARRLNATLGFALLRLSDGGFWLGTTSRTIPRGRRFVEYDKRDVTEVFEVRGLTGRGVGFSTTDGKTNYFWTMRPSRVMGVVGKLGYPIGHARRARGLVLDQFPLPWRRNSRQPPEK